VNQTLILSYFYCSISIRLLFTAPRSPNPLVRSFCSYKWPAQNTLGPLEAEARRNCANIYMVGDPV
jgi:hypothetical protein